MKLFPLYLALVSSVALAATDAHLEIAKPATTGATMLAPASAEHAIVYKEAGRYGGWPANHGLWQWGDELVVGFTSTWYKQTTTDHRIDRTKPSYEWQARSLDGGKTWKTESDLPFADREKEAKPSPLTEALDFTAPDFALMFRFGSLHAGPSWFYTTTDRCKTWRGPYSFSVEGITRICTRTDLIVLGPRDCLMFGSCAKQSDQKEGRVFCARTTDGGLNWKLVSLIGPEPMEGGYAIMPSSLRLKDGSILTMIRRSDPKVSGFIEAWRSTDLGKTWAFHGRAVSGIGGNPPALVQLQDGRVAVTYGFRHKPSGMRACVSADGGRSWGAEINLRGDAFDGDMGYPRSIVRPDGKVLTVYYFNGPKEDDRAIESTLWTAPPAVPSPITAAMQPLVDQHHIAGAVTLVANREKVVALDSVGYASLANKTPMRTDAMFWIASMSKSITATALMMLVDEGKVGLDDPVEKYLPEFKDQQVKEADGSLHAPKHPITVREIMSHTSGLVLASEKELKKTQSLKENVEAYAAWPLHQEPGTKYEYNNCGINTGGRIIEVVSGKSYSDFMQQRVFDPLGMTDTTFWPNDEQMERLAHSARFNASKTDLEEVKLDTNVTPAMIAKFSEGVHVPAPIIAEMGFGIAFSYGKHYGEPAGGYFSTAHDVGVLCQMLLNKGVFNGRRLLSEKAVQLMTSSQTNGVAVNPSESYGIGWSTKLKDDEGPSIGSFGHRGARRTAMWVDPLKQLVMVVLVERFDMTGEEQKLLYGGFMQAAVKAFGNAKP